MSKIELPTFDELMNPLLQALHELGGSGTIDEINSKTIEIARLSTQQIEVLHDPERGSQTEVEYRLAWTRTYLRKYGLLENSARSVWALTLQGREEGYIDTDRVKRYVRNLDKQNQLVSTPANSQESETELSWREKLLEVLLTMEPSAFERLAQRMLRESGFTQVEVLGRSGDGGIDGKGILRLGGLISFHVYFQCKRYQGAVSAGQIRDFRGALVGRADKGLFITTGSFTKDAIKEATRDGAPPIDLIDSDELISRLKELGLGVKTEMVEQITINSDWFFGI